MQDMTKKVVQDRNTEKEKSVEKNNFGKKKNLICTFKPPNYF